MKKHLLTDCLARLLACPYAGEAMGIESVVFRRGNAPSLSPYDA